MVGIIGCELSPAMSIRLWSSPESEGKMSNKNNFLSLHNFKKKYMCIRHILAQVFSCTPHMYSSFCLNKLESV